MVVGSIPAQLVDIFSFLRSSYKAGSWRIVPPHANTQCLKWRIQAGSKHGTDRFNTRSTLPCAGYKNSI